MSKKMDVLFNEIPGNGGGVGLITLNRPKALNALTHEMTCQIRFQLELWAKASHIKAAVIYSEPGGRAFCAGGDLKWLYYHSATKEKTVGFFYDEYRLNKTIFFFPKPYIAILDGITMGGGVGISIHGSHRVGTDNLLFAMPEARIGFFPDVGGTYFLPRLKNHLGFYLGLTGDTIQSDDCVALNIIHHKVAFSNTHSIIQAIADLSFGPKAFEAIHHTLATFSIVANPSKLLQQAHFFAECFNKNSLEEILQALQLSSHPLSEAIIARLNKNSPTSLKVILQALQRGKELSFNECMEQEYLLARAFLHSHDFFEGIRATIIDKNKNPHWNPSTLDQITSKIIEKYFHPAVNKL